MWSFGTWFTKKSFENNNPNINQGDVLLKLQKYVNYFFDQTILENKIWKAALEFEKIWSLDGLY